MHEYKKLNVWIEAMDLVTVIYQVTKNYPQEEKFGMISQIRRCAVSIPSNIAEGAGRNSDKEFANFLGIANASSFELETQLVISKNLGYINENDLAVFSDKIDKIQKMIFKLKKTILKD